MLVASGRYDLGTPYSATDWSLAQLDAPPEVLARVSHHYFDAGHMMYTREADMMKLKRDLAAWLGGSRHGEQVDSIFAQVSSECGAGGRGCSRFELSTRRSLSVR